MDKFKTIEEYCSTKMQLKQKEKLILENIIRTLCDEIPIIVHKVEKNKDIFSVFQLDDIYLDEYVLEKGTGEGEPLILRKVDRYIADDDIMESIYFNDVLKAENVYYDLEEETNKLPIALNIGRNIY